MREPGRGATWSSILMLALALAGCGEADRPVWLAPNLASRDMVRLFTDPGEWDRSRQDVGGSQFYAVQLGALDGCGNCGGNVLAGFASAGAFEKLRRWGIATAVEAGALKDWGCTAEATLPLTARAIANVRAASGDVQYVAMDEPLLGGQDCDLSAAASAAEVARYAAGLRTSLPVPRSPFRRDLLGRGRSRRGRVRGGRAGVGGRRPRRDRDAGADRVPELGRLR